MVSRGTLILAGGRSVGRLISVVITKCASSPPSFTSPLSLYFLFFLVFPLFCLFVVVLFVLLFFFFFFSFLVYFFVLLTPYSSYTPSSSHSFHSTVPHISVPPIIPILSGNQRGCREGFGRGDSRPGGRFADRTYLFSFLFLSSSLFLLFSFCLPLSLPLSLFPSLFHS